MRDPFAHDIGGGALTGPFQTPQGTHLRSHRSGRVHASSGFLVLDVTMRWDDARTEGGGHATVAADIEFDDLDGP
jgi:hypothetical protein